MRLIFVGPPGVGKGTQCERLVELLAIPHLSTGEILRQAIVEGTQVGRASESYMSQGKLVPDEIVLRIMRQRLDQPDCQNGYLLDGFPRTIVQAKSLDEYLEQRGTPMSCVLELKVDKQHIIERLSVRGRADDRPEIIRERLNRYDEQTAPLIEYYRAQGLLREIDGLGSPDEVFERIRQVLPVS